MDTPLIDLSIFLPIIEQDQPIVTANSRLSAKVIQAYTWHVGNSKKHKVIEKPAVFSLGEWLDMQWQNAQAQGDIRTAVMRLNTQQKLSIWESIIAARLDDMPMARADHLSHLADKALKTLHLWQLTLDDLQGHLSFFEGDANTLNHSPFKEWAQVFLALTERHRWITSEQQQAILLDIAHDDSFDKHETIYLYGFDDIPPLTQALLDASCHQLTSLTNPNPLPDHHSIRRVECQQLDEEIAQAARWSWQRLRQEPNQRIGIIVPQLGQIRDRVERQFIATFEAHALLPEQARYTLPFNFSAGIPLAQCPLIAQALQLLRWVNGQSLPWHQVKHLLLSPFWQLGNNESLAILWLQTLQNKEQTEWTWQAAIQCLYELVNDHNTVQQAQSSNDDVHCDDDIQNDVLDQAALSDWLSHLSSTLAPFNTQKIQDKTAIDGRPQTWATIPKTPQQWVEQFNQQLNLLGWPGARRLDSQEYQQMVEWQQGLLQVKSMDLVVSSWSNQEALRQLTQLMNTTPFQALTPDSPIQILGALEGAGLKFNACWILGLDNQQWPSAAKPNPLLPIALQHDHKMPNATPERELEFAKSLTQSYFQSAPTVVVSSAQFDGEKELHPSPLIESIEKSSLNTVVASTECPAHLPTHYQRQWKNKRWSWVPTHFTQPFPPQIQEQAGGASLLQWQSSNPMDAFARFRLQLFSLAEMSDHLASYVKGNITHTALEILWKQLKTQSELLLLTDDHRNSMVSESVSLALGQELPMSHQYGEHFRSLEHRRQCELIENWLQMEMLRPPFRVQSIESQQRMTLSYLTLKVRLDRVDVLLDNQLQDSGSILIDYKTGSCNRSDWRFDRVKSPQLPLYAIGYPAKLSGQTVSAIAFGQIKAGSIQLSGMADGTIENSIDANWDNQADWIQRLHEWRQQLTQLAQEWLRGDCHNYYYHTDAQKYQQDYFAFNRWPEKPMLYQQWLAENQAQ